MASDARSPVLAAVLTGPLLATCSTKENAAGPFGATLSANRFAFGLGQPNHQRGRAALLVGEWRSAGTWCHAATIAQYGNLGNGVDDPTSAQYIKYMNTTQNNRRELTDAQYDAADRIVELFRSDPTSDYTVSRLARKIHATYLDTSAALTDLVEALDTVDCDDRGAWTHFYPLTDENRARKLRNL